MTFYYGICVGATGESIRFNSNGYMEGEKSVHGSCGDSSAYFWIQDDEDGTEKNAVRIGGVYDGKPSIEIVKIFSGYRLPVLVVRK